MSFTTTGLSFGQHPLPCLMGRGWKAAEKSETTGQCPVVLKESSDRETEKTFQQLVAGLLGLDATSAQVSPKSSHRPPPSGCRGRNGSVDALGSPWEPDQRDRKRSGRGTVCFLTAD